MTLRRNSRRSPRNLKMSDPTIYDIKHNLKERVSSHFSPKEADMVCHRLAQFFVLMKGIESGDKLSERNLVRIMANNSDRFRPYIHSLGIWLGCETDFISSLRDTIPDALRLYYSDQIHVEIRTAVSQSYRKKRRWFRFFR